MPTDRYRRETSKYFDTIRHSVLIDKIAKRVQDPQVLHLVKQIIKVGGKIGVPQGGPFSPLAANIYLNELDWTFDAIRQKTAQGPYEAVNYHRFADDIVITVSRHHTKRGWAKRAQQRAPRTAHTSRCGATRRKQRWWTVSDCNRTKAIVHRNSAAQSSCSGASFHDPDFPCFQGVQGVHGIFVEHKLS
jgi:hypothetical protein